MDNTKKAKPSAVKEFVRKIIVSLKRSPQTIPLLILVIAFLYYSLNLTHISDTTAKIQASNMGLCGFATMLFSMLSMVCCMNAFPVRKKVNKPMLVLMFIMLIIIIGADLMYFNAIVAAISREENRIALTDYILSAMTVVYVHWQILVVAIISVILLPVYSKLIRRIKTSVELEETENIGHIDIAGDA